ncbi:MAG TPA: TetR/AcrR family transcriptional regulator, partial [Firmicutes bacterium]|nr:TetR/AcrR family transcriptional regulator [Bacillota bacterium]
MRQIKENVSPMSNEGRNAYVKKHLTDAFLSLLAEKNIEDISISELAAEAGVGRASFYRNYEHK